MRRTDTDRFLYTAVCRTIRSILVSATSRPNAVRSLHAEPTNLRLVYDMGEKIIIKFVSLHVRIRFPDYNHLVRRHPAHKLTPHKTPSESKCVRFPHRLQVGVEIVHKWLPRRNLQSLDTLLVHVIQPEPLTRSLKHCTYERSGARSQALEHARLQHCGNESVSLY